MIRVATALSIVSALIPASGVHHCEDACHGKELLAGVLNVVV
jgi:hypothetical protein